MGQKNEPVLTSVWRLDGTVVNREEKNWLRSVGFTILDRLPDEPWVARARAHSLDEREYWVVLTWPRVGHTPETR